MNERPIELMAQALKGAEAAHAEHEKKLGHPDPDWQTWYAGWIIANCDLRTIANMVVWE